MKKLGKNMPFENILNLNVRAFFFNVATDYLPYYKNFEISIDKGATLLDLLHRIKTVNPNFSFPNKNIILKLNGEITTAETLVNDVVEKMGEELLIEPATSYRSVNGLILNDDDFMQSFELLAPYASEEDKSFYESLYTVHYASESSNYNREYIGDAILILAEKMIRQGNEHKEEILEAISDNFNGIINCEYENNVFNGQDYSKEITYLKNMVELKDRATKCDKVVFGFKKHTLEIDTLEGVNIALYLGDKLSTKLEEKTHKAVKEAGANLIKFERAYKKAGQTLMETNYQLAHLKAGTMLLEALDSGATMLICSKVADVNIFQKALIHCEKIMGREIKLNIISLDTFEELASSVTA